MLDKGTRITNILLEQLQQLTVLLTVCTAVILLYLRLTKNIQVLKWISKAHKNTIMI